MKNGVYLCRVVCITVSPSQALLVYLEKVPENRQTIIFIYRGHEMQQSRLLLRGTFPPLLLPPAD